MSNKPQPSWTWKKWHFLPIIVMSATIVATFAHFAAMQSNNILFWLLWGGEVLTSFLAIALTIVVRGEITEQEKKTRKEKQETSM